MQLEMNDFQFVLESYKGKNSRHTCPSCEKAYEFTRYIDRETGQHVHPTVGKCNRQSNCGYHYPPRQYFIDHPDSSSARTWQPPQPAARRKPAPLPPPSTIPRNVFEHSQQRYEANNFVRWLQSLFGMDVAADLVRRYHIGTSKHWAGSTVFWQVNSQGEIRAGKIMLYDQQSGKRVKKPFDHVSWAHSAMKLKDYYLQPCLFGEHLITQAPKMPIAIVESEKTAIICSAFLPQFIWLAAGGKDHLHPDKLKPLKGREIMLFPDFGAFDQWHEKAAQTRGFGKIVVSDFLEKNAPAQDQGTDLADYFVKPDPISGFAINSEGYPAFWDVPSTSPARWKEHLSEALQSVPNDSSPLAGMIAKNPSLNALISLFDLESVEAKGLQNLTLSP